ncbi:unnamed protein product [Orchesella dallaii]|uniref:Lipocalin/cytosolic fatty-acid binding domain-containing protein n=1 Tax=Orchesella dallaii TaxID=48710 RepID=A0ABP1QJI2_9HEXA
MSVVGKFELLSDPSDKAWDEYLVAVGVSDAHREAGRMVSPSVEISQAGGKYTLKTLSELKNTEITFPLGQEIDEDTADNRKCKTTFTLDGNKLIQTQKLEGKESKTVREFSADGMTATFTAAGKTAVRKYKRVA